MSRAPQDATPTQDAIPIPTPTRRRGRQLTVRIVNGRRIVDGIRHVRTGYTNYGCRCDDCAEAQRLYQREWCGSF